ncbi:MULTISPECIES: aminotransferase class I/II-fold pyridoxal phosphate-dependent enzyme [unclassified Streptomyces]|uniref:aminotransferase class I/II-fold pyridoxal phosphate-dependent enzyme n=1 Tax=unclassified Streptomyces TaxID=2593676 RepID=UPI001F0354A8|nr:MULTISPECIES: aminotransferase class I/II-fold pyridoxal phosphate-dependent enzyme [unclassified Streptomyces]MCH0566179.1 aminotransferase class I/II-fold pyridoxal phosphate-dependent enzyme [Streptomyces sp. MUM 2J]MCH0572009.1 aminotransferase class I/II-fold pyridoxal phosphate-dependent enzyme [Streptomyces sp. MUM 136J]
MTSDHLQYVDDEMLDALYRCRSRSADEGKLVEVVSNDYLALGGHPDIAAAQREADERFGNGNRMAAPHLFADDPQRRLEERIAAWLGVEAVVLTQSGWTANFGLMQVLARGVRVFRDGTAHTSLTDGALAARAEIHDVRHNDPAHLDELLRRHGPGLVVLNAVYNVRGDLTPLAAMTEVAERYGAEVVLDESHSLGALGPAGRGLAAGVGPGGRVAHRTASLAKAFTARAGIVATSRTAAEQVRYRARSACFASTLLPRDIAGIDATLTLVEHADQARARLAGLTADLRQGLDRQGWDVGDGAHIASLVHTTLPRLARSVAVLDAAAIRTSAFVLPVPRPGHLPLRICLHAALTGHDLDRILDATALLRTEPV